MNIYEYVNAVANEVKATLGEGYEVRPNEVIKNNNRILHTVYIRKEGFPIASNINVDDMLESDFSVTDAANKVVELYKPNDITNWDKISQKIVMTVVNTERNAAFLKDVAYENIEDLSIIYKVLLTNSDRDLSAMTVKNEHLNYWYKTVEDLRGVAMRNTSKLLPYKVEVVDDIVKKMYLEAGLPEAKINEFFDRIPIKQRMWVISNEDNLFGAVNMFNSSALDEVANKVDSDLYILPASIHEVIAVSTDIEKSPEDLKDLVGFVNGEEIAPEEQLSDNIYRYDRKNKTVSIVV